MTPNDIHPLLAPETLPPGTLPAGTLAAEALSVRLHNGYIVVTIDGELGNSRVPALRAQLLDLLRPHDSRIVVDLAEVTYCDASGLAVLVGVARRAWLLGGVLRLAAPSASVRAALRLTGLDQHFEIAATVPAAAGGPAHPRLPDKALRRQLPVSKLSTRPAGPRTHRPENP
jgi:anti-anti-sigma factor